MKLLVEQNLSRNRVGRLRDYFPDSAHVTTLGLETATDKDVSDHAGEPGYTTASKDSDLRQLAFPQVLTDHHEAIEAFESAAEEALLVRPGLPRE